MGCAHVRQSVHARMIEEVSIRAEELEREPATCFGPEHLEPDCAARIACLPEDVDHLAEGSNSHRLRFAHGGVNAMRDERLDHVAEALGIDLSPYEQSVQRLVSVEQCHPSRCHGVRQRRARKLREDAVAVSWGRESGRGALRLRGLRGRTWRRGRRASTAPCRSAPRAHETGFRRGRTSGQGWWSPRLVASFAHECGARKRARTDTGSSTWRAAAVSRSSSASSVGVVGVAAPSSPRRRVVERPLPSAQQVRPAGEARVLQLVRRREQRGLLAAGRPAVSRTVSRKVRPALLCAGCRAPTGRRPRARPTGPSVRTDRGEQVRERIVGATGNAVSKRATPKSLGACDDFPGVPRKLEVSCRNLQVDVHLSGCPHCESCGAR